jgi:hypothetical protein
MGLSFLTPMLLGGAALVAVPIVLHLIMRRKPVPYEFPALRFLRERAVANRRRLRLSHLVLLLLRMATLLLLALALARPVLRGAGWLASGEGPVAAAFVFDTAPRMAVREANRSRLEQAAAMARILFGKLPAASKVAVVDTGGGAVAFAPTVAAAATRIDRLAVTTPAMSLVSAIDEGLRVLQGADIPRRELYVFTDCSRGAWGNAAALDIAKTHPETSVLFVDVGSVTPQDFALEAVELATDQIAAGTPLGLTAVVSRTGPNATRAVAVELLGENGRYVRRAAKPVTWKQGGGQEVDFEIAGLDVGLRQGRVVIDGTDEFEADDARYFTVEVGAPPRIIVAAPAPAARTGRFVVEALAPVALRKTGKARFDARLIDVAELGSTTWDDAQGMVLVDPPPLDSRTWDAVRDWVSSGKGLVVWLGPRAGDAARFNSAASAALLGGRIVRVWRSPDRSNHIAPTALDNPLLAAFRRVGDAVPWQDFPVVRHWEFMPDEEAGAAAIVAPYRNGLPALLERRVGQGTVVIVTTPVSQAADDPEAWNSLATGFEPWPFVMLANETLRHAVDTTDDRNVVAGTPAVLHLGRRDVTTAFVRTPAGDDVPVAVEQKRGTVTVTDTRAPGNYILRVGGDANAMRKGFSANLDSPAVDFSRLSPDTLAGLLGPGHRLARTEQELVRDVSLERVGTELFGWLAVLAAVVMAADWIAANRFYAPRDSATAGPNAAESFSRMVAGQDSAAAAAPLPAGTPPPVPPPPPAAPPSPPGSPPPPPPPPPPRFRGGPPPVPPLQESRT